MFFIPFQWIAADHFGNVYEYNITTGFRMNLLAETDCDRDATTYMVACSVVRVNGEDRCCARTRKCALILFSI